MTLRGLGLGAPCRTSYLSPLPSIVPSWGGNGGPSLSLSGGGKTQAISYLLQDNSNTLGAMIKGYSGSELADRSAMVVALSCAILRCRIWFEYVQSKSKLG